MNPGTTMDSAENQILAGLKTIREHWGYFLASGVAFLVLGTIALAFTVFTTLASVFVFGVAFFIGGMFQTVHALKTMSASKWNGFLLDLAVGALYIITGLLMAVHPLAGAQSLTLLLAALFLAVGSFRTMGAVILRPPSWGWLLASGMVTFLLGILVWVQWPESALWLIGTLVAIDMIFNGVWLVTLALNARGLSPQEIQERSELAQPGAIFEQQPTRRAG
ncbi:MAG TPA: HdeD family acid-resistance protein [Nitrospira sp.]|nr:HdeD family acid-resistance protein [Nitrospira sp.]